MNDTQKEIWLNPVGGLGDVLMTSGVLKLCYEQNPNQTYHLIRRNRYVNLLKGHPAIKSIGFPPEDAEIVCNNYWSKEPLGDNSQRAFQVLARSFGLSTPVEEKLYLSENEEDDPLLDKFIDFKKTNIVIAPASDSPRKMMHPMAWHILVEKFVNQGFNVIQIGKSNELYIKGTYSLLGLTTPRQAIALIKKCTLVITVDNFIMHAAHLTQTPTIALFGATNSKTYGYADQILLQAATDHCELKNQCLGVDFSHNYATPCPLIEKHCMNRISVDEIWQKAQNFL